MLDLSIIIVNYNVQFFLKQCIDSIYDSDTNFQYEIIVVDNCSTDDSSSIIQTQFPEVIWIQNQENIGFGAANNIAIKQTKSKYCLILNPDTLLNNDTLQKCYEQMELDLQIGALGVGMYDGAGNYLPESKRGMPTTWNAFCKFSGLYKLNPRSKLLNGYYLGHLPNDETTQIEVLTGAFMFCRSKALKEAGMFDERYFMYGEDIDLSYTISNLGYKVLYMPSVSIIHYKGESTKKSDKSYSRHFFNAMELFYEKYSNKKRGFRSLIKMAIGLGGFLSWFRHALKKELRALTDTILVFLALCLVSFSWAQYKFEDSLYYTGVPLYQYLFFIAAIWVAIHFYFGHYDEKVSYRKFFLGSVFGGLMLFSIYSFLPESIRFSRAIILMLIPVGTGVLWMTRKLYNKVSTGKYSFIPGNRKSVLILGSKTSSKQVYQILNNRKLVYNSINIPGFDFRKAITKSGAQQIREIYRPDELIFCSKEIENEEMFKWMSFLGPKINYKIASKDNDSILGSDSKNRMGNWFTLDVTYRIEDITRKRFKRTTDLMITLVLLLLFPLVKLLDRSKKVTLSNLFQVGIANMSLVGYAEIIDNNKLPKIKKGLFDTRALSSSLMVDSEELKRMNLYYAKNYAVWQDLEIVWKNIFNGS